jgi:hypothetical protein
MLPARNCGVSLGIRQPGIRCICWNEGVRVSPSILARAFFLLWLEKPISGELVKEEYPLINSVIAKKSTA